MRRVNAAGGRFLRFVEMMRRVLGVMKLCGDSKPDP